MKPLVLCFLFFFSFSGLAGEKINYYIVDEEDDDDTSCIPKLADDCFRFLSQKMHCRSDPSPSRDCEKGKAEDICSALDGGIKCAEDIIDGDCTSTDGRGHFDLWIVGLKKVMKNLCSNNMQLLKVLLESSSCWDSEKFTSCLEKERSVLHITDFLKQSPDLNNCYRLSIHIAMCTSKATLSNISCEHPLGVMKEVLHSFFSAGTCSNATNGQKRKFSVLEFFINCFITGNILWICLWI